uniref:Uncharacterized protein n=1 Tax=Anguilla anguilla TaxID=7936 RepID=A0A0E9V311_ANGAN
MLISVFSSGYTNSCAIWDILLPCLIAMSTMALSISESL